MLALFVYIGSVILFPEWLNQIDWYWKLLIVIIGGALLKFLKELFSGGTKKYFEGLNLYERLDYYLGNKFAKISERIDEFTFQEIKKEKNSNKYIPDIFVEVSEIKEKLRYFCDPFLFYEKITKRTEANLKNAYIIKLLKTLNYPLEDYSQEYFPKKIKNKNTLVDEIKRYQSEIIKKEKLLEIFVKENGAGIKPEFLDKIPDNIKYKYDYIYPNLQYFSSYEHIISDLRNDLKILQSGYLLLKSEAGHGKTNLICDFAEKYLLKKNKKTIYLSARQFNDISDNETIEEKLIKILFGNNKYTFDDLILLVKFGKNLGKLFILIDGINEHRNISLFSQKLEQFLQRCKSIDEVKIILTCRSEYFDHRFGNLKLLENISILDIDARRFDPRIPQVHREHLITKYFEHFNINLNVERVSEDIQQQFDQDKLLLRIFCEANQGSPQPEYINNLYRLEIFTKYLIVKGTTIANLKNTISVIVDWMIEKNVYSDIPLSGFQQDIQFLIDEIANENIILKRDIKIKADVAFGDEEVINFVYDEFRDFLIASRILLLWEVKREFSEELINRLSVPRCVISEGVTKYLCLWAIKNHNEDLIEHFRQFEWFEVMITDSIFGSPDEYIRENQISLLKQIFKNPKLTLQIFLQLSYFYDFTKHPNLNIDTLFEIIFELTDPDYFGYFSESLNQKKFFDEESYKELPVITILSIRIYEALIREMNDLKISKLIKLLACLVCVENKYSDKTDYYGKVHDYEEVIYPAYNALEDLLKVVDTVLLEKMILEVKEKIMISEVKEKLSSIIQLLEETCDIKT